MCSGWGLQLKSTVAAREDDVCASVTKSICLQTTINALETKLAESTAATVPEPSENADLSLTVR